MKHKALILKLARDKIHILKTVEHYGKLNSEQTAIKKECLELIESHNGGYTPHPDPSGLLDASQGYQPIARDNGEPLSPPGGRVMVTYGSICSGIESASMAWEPLGMEVQWFAEIEKFPSAVLAHHWPHIANLGNMCVLPSMVESGLIQAPDILVGGTPCQAFSVAGLRKGLDDERGQLTLKFVELANEIDKQREGDECVVVWENVPGVLSSKDNAFGCFLGALAGEDCELKPAGKKWTNAGCVYGPERTVAWRILDAQYFGVAQRRRRVFVVASARDGFDPTKVLFEREGVRRDIKPSRETGQGITGDTTPGPGESVNKVAYGVDTYNKTIKKETAKTLQAGSDNEHVGCVLQNPEVIPIHDKATRYRGATGKGSGDGLGVGSNSSPMFTLTTGDNHALLQTPHVFKVRGGCEGGGKGYLGNSEVAYTISTHQDQDLFTSEGHPRKLTPKECERLQGFPDSHTRIPWGNKEIDECPDGPRYKAIGNSKAVPVIKWVGERILEELNRES